MFLQYDKLLQDELAKREPCDILFACDLYSLKASAQARKIGKAKKLFYDARELYTELPTVAGNPIKKLFWKRWERRGLTQTDVVIVTAPDDAGAIKQVHGFLPESILIRNLPKREGFNLNNYLRDYFAIPGNKKIMVYVGGLQLDRGLEKVIESMRVLKTEAVFIMVGEGELEETLQKKTKQLDLDNDIFFHPPIESARVIEILSSADIGISLIEQSSKSYQLALPSKIFEYMLAGLPVISSPLKQVKDLFDKRDNIFYADPDNETELIETCRTALAVNNNLEIKQSIRNKASKNYTFETDSELLTKYLAKLIN